MSNLRFRVVLAAIALTSPAVAVAGDDLTADYIKTMVPGSNDTRVPTVEFAPASARVSSADRSRIQRIAKTWVLGSPQRVIEVHGYSDSLDLALAQRRAEIIRGYLIASGIEPTRVVAVGHTLDAGGPRIDVAFRTCAAAQCPTAVATSSVVNVGTDDEVTELLADLDRPLADPPALLAAEKADATASRISLRFSTKKRAKAKAPTLGIARAPAPTPVLSLAPSPALPEIDMTPDTVDPGASVSQDVVFHGLIEFAPASARVYSADRELIARMARAWQHGGQQTTITVHGYSESLDLRLAERRAHNIRRYLIKAGVAPSQIAIVGHTLAKEGRRVDLAVAQLAK